MSRPLSALPKVLADMGDATKTISGEACRKATDVVHDTVRSSGRRFHIKGRGGKGKHALGASKDVKAFNTRSGSAVARGAVFGIPQGFWTIVEDGSRPHIIKGRFQSGHEGKKAGVRFKRRAAKNLASRLFGGTGTALGSSPIRIPGVGWREYAHHPGHGTLGHPWEEAMAFASRQVPDVIAKESTVRFAKAFL